MMGFSVIAFAGIAEAAPRTVLLFGLSPEPSRHEVKAGLCLKVKSVAKRERLYLEPLSIFISICNIAMHRCHSLMLKMCNVARYPACWLFEAL